MIFPHFLDLEKSSEFNLIIEIKVRDSEFINSMSTENGSMELFLIL